MAYSEDIIDRLRRKARAVSGRDARQWRKDQYGAWIFRPHYGNNATEHGWKVEKHCGGRGRPDREPAALSPRQRVRHRERQGALLGGCRSRWFGP
jgi:hypothetical protein